MDERLRVLETQAAFLYGDCERRLARRMVLVASVPLGVLSVGLRVALALQALAMLAAALALWWAPPLRMLHAPVGRAPAAGGRR